MTTLWGAIPGREDRRALAVLLVEGVREVGHALESDGVGDLADRSGPGPQELLGPLEAQRADQTGGGFAGEGPQLAQQIGAVAPQGRGERSDRQLGIAEPLLHDGL